MGLLRILLAFSVLLSHSPTKFYLPIIPPGLAVQSFFVISGFYMALILEKKYAGEHGGYKIFITNRFLRIFPIYWIVLSTILALAALKYALHLVSDENLVLLLTHFYAHSSIQATIFGLTGDFFRNFTLLITNDYINSVPRDQAYLLVAPAWTLQYELFFYLMVPFILKLKQGFFVLLIFLLTLLRFSFIIPIDHRSVVAGFLGSLPFFLFGIVSFTLYKYIRTKNFTLGKLRLLNAFLAIVLIFYSVIPLISATIFTYASGLYFLLLIILIPFIFLSTKNIPLDRFIGQISYPFYISHILIIKFLDNIVLLKGHQDYFTIMVIILSFIVSLMLLKYVDVPIDVVRQLRVKSASIKKNRKYNLGNSYSSR